MIVFSVIAGVPVYFAHKIFVEKFASLGNMLGNGLAIIASAFIFAVIGIFLLIVTKDKALVAVKNKITKPGAEK